MAKLILLFISVFALFAGEIEIETSKIREFHKTVRVNAQVVQLKYQKESVVSRISGHIERYFVKPGDNVRKGDKIALIKSLELSRLTAQYLSLKDTVSDLIETFNTKQRLFNKGLASKMELIEDRIKLNEALSKLKAMQSKLESLDIDPQKIKEPTDAFYLFSHMGGTVDSLGVSVHSAVNADTPVATIVTKGGFYIEAYVPLSRFTSFKRGPKGEFVFADSRYDLEFYKLLPKIDPKTQRARLLFKIVGSKPDLLLGAYGEARIYSVSVGEYVAVKKSAVTMFKGERVVFVPVNEHEWESISHKNEHDREDEHDHLHEKDHESGHDHDLKEFEPVVIEPLFTEGDYIAVKGLETGREYVSKGVYYVKSLILKSELGGHGH